MKNALERDPSDDEPLDGAMGFLDHLEELRTRIIRACVALGLGMLVSFAFIERIADFVLGPTLAALPPGASLITTRLGEGLSLYMDLALLGGVVLAAPFITYQLWRFIAPGLYARERRLVVPFVALATLGTLLGAAFTHFVLFPSMVAFFGTFDTPRMRLMPRVEDTFGLYKNMLLGMVAVFQIPTLAFFLARLGVVSARLLWRYFAHAVLASFVASAVLTPSSDPWNQVMFAGPMIALYLVGIAVAWLVAPKPGHAGRPAGSSHLRLVFAATVLDHAARRQRPNALLRRLAQARQGRS